MTAAEIARDIRAKEVLARAREAQIAREEMEARDKQFNVTAQWIVSALESFGSEFTIEKKWFGGSNYWTLKKGGTALVSCVLFYEQGTWSPSDDCRNVPYERWAVRVIPGEWAGPHDNRGTVGISNQVALNQRVGEIMSKHL